MSKTVTYNFQQQFTGWQEVEATYEVSDDFDPNDKSQVFSLLNQSHDALGDLVDETLGDELIDLRDYIDYRDNIEIETLPLPMTGINVSYTSGKTSGDIPKSEGLKYDVSDIRWDADCLDDVIGLPTSMIVNIPPGITGEYEIDEFISNYMSETGQFTHTGYSSSKIEEPVINSSIDFEGLAIETATLSFKNPGEPVFIITELMNDSLVSNDEVIAFTNDLMNKIKSIGDKEYGIYPGEMMSNIKKFIELSNYPSNAPSPKI
jgi:hypothetical protein